MATINISLPDPLYKEVKKLVSLGGYTSLSELIRDALRKKLDGSKITVNGFTEEFEKEVLRFSASPEKGDIILKTDEETDGYFRHLKLPVRYSKKKKLHGARKVFRQVRANV